MKLNLALAAALSLSNTNIVSISAELAAEEIEELNTLFAEEIHLEEQNEEILNELSELTQTRFDIGGGEEEEEVDMVAQSDTLEGGEEEGGDIVLNFDAPDLRVEDEEGEGYDELPEDGIAYTTSAMEEDNSSNEEEEAVHVPTKHELHHAAKIAAKANKHHDMLSKAHSMKSIEKKHSKAAKAVHHDSKGSKRGKMGKAHLSMPTTHSGKANKMVEHEAKTHKSPSTATVKSTSQSASSSSKANKATDSTEAVPMPIEAPVPAEGDDDVTELNMEPVPRTPDVPAAHNHVGTDTSELNGRLKQEMAEVMLGDTSHVGKGHSQSNENVAALDLLRAKSDAAQSSGGSVVGRSVGIVGGVCLVGSILYGMM